MKKTFHKTHGFSFTENHDVNVYNFLTSSHLLVAFSRLKLVNNKVDIFSLLSHTHCTKQCAAVMTQWEVMMDPPHTCLPRQCKLVCHPHWSFAASVPPTIRIPWDPAFTAVVQSGRQRPSSLRQEETVCHIIIKSIIYTSDGTWGNVGGIVGWIFHWIEGRRCDGAVRWAASRGVSRFGWETHKLH